MVLQIAARDSIYRRCRPEYSIAQELKLEADTTPEEAIGRDQHDLTVARGQGDIPLSEDIPAIGDDFGMAGNEPR
jgi:hypothetical protein